jgi:hypothetical protein
MLMPLQVNDLETLQGFVHGAMARAELHAKQVRAITLAILGGIIWRLEPGTVKIQFHEGQLSNALLWESISERSYACTYNSGTGELEVRDSSARGPVLHVFTNATPITDVESFFSKL